MSTTALSLPYSPAFLPSRTLAIFARETRYEFVRALRTRAFSLSVIGFPVMFYVLFGVMNRNETMHGGAWRCWCPQTRRRVSST
jgi:ABC-2 type transport system permease protein